MNQCASSSSPDPTTSQGKYDVFISFRGEDTRYNFTSHLYTALTEKKISTFIDELNLERGEEISSSLLKVIEQSKISIVILSKNYASSKWCLEELVKIMNCWRNNKLMVLPVFYGVDPSHVRRQTDGFAVAFKNHEKSLTVCKQKVQRWRAALTDVANLSGYHLLPNRSESDYITEIVGNILKKVNRTSIGYYHKGLVGIESQIQDIKPLLSLESSNVRIVGISGMGVLGKTTLARASYDQISTQFESCCFLTDTREQLKKCILSQSKNELFSTLLEEGNAFASTLNLRESFIKDRLHHKKVLIVVDNVDNSIKQQELLAGVHDLFAVRSRILVTSRNKQVLKITVDEIYTMEKLNEYEALQLFSMNAFKQDCPLSDHKLQALWVINYTKGNPLALKVLGSALLGKSDKDWESMSKRLGNILNSQIHNVLRTSYYGLDSEEQRIFLDITCFFGGQSRDYLTKIMGSFDSSMHFSITTLNITPKRWSKSRDPKRRSKSIAPKRRKSRDLERQSKSRDPKRQRKSRDLERQSISRDLERWSILRDRGRSRYYERQRISRDCKRWSKSKDIERQSISRDLERQNISRDRGRSRDRRRQSISRDHDRHSISRDLERHSISRDAERQRKSRDPKRWSNSRDSKRRSISRDLERWSILKDPKRSKSRDPERQSKSRGPKRRSKSKDIKRQSISRDPERHPKRWRRSRDHERQTISRDLERWSILKDPKSSKLRDPERQCELIGPKRRSKSRAIDKHSISKDLKRQSISRDPERHPRRQSKSRDCKRQSIPRDLERWSILKDPKRSKSRDPKRQSKSRGPKRWSKSRDIKRQSISRDPKRHPKRQSKSRDHERRSISRDRERRSISRVLERWSILKDPKRSKSISPKRRIKSRDIERQSISRDRGRSRDRRRQSISRHCVRQSISRDLERHSISRNAERQRKSRSPKRQSKSRDRERQSISRDLER